MWYGSKLDRFASALVVISVGVLVSGTKACQEDYQFAAQSTVTETPEGTITGTPSGSPTGAPTTTGTVTAAPTVTGTVPATATGEDDDSAATVGEDDLFQELSALGGQTGGAAAGAGVVMGAKGENWLGEAFSKDDGSWQDSDADGFSDTLEEQYETDPQKAGSVPQGAAESRLEERLRPQDIELEAQRMAAELKGEDGEPNPDDDQDGVPNDLEKDRGMNSSAADSDQDGLRDDRELVLGTNPINPDSDGDGISDNREYLNGSDPTIPEPKKV